MKKNSVLLSFAVIGVITILLLFDMQRPTSAASNSLYSKVKAMSGYNASNEPEIESSIRLEPSDIKNLIRGGKPNYTYVVSSNINLEGKTLNVPDNCLLRFEGGIISNGVIVGNNTAIEASPRQIFSTDITLTGTWCVNEAFVEWFGCKATKTYNKGIALKNAEAIQKTVNTFANVSFGTSNNNQVFYYLSANRGSRAVVSIHEPVTVSGQNPVSTQIVYVGEEDIPVFLMTKDEAKYVFGPRFSTIQNLCVRGENDKCRKGSGISVDYGVAYVIINNVYCCYFNNCFVSDSWSITFNNCKAEVSNVGFKLGVNNQGLPANNLTRCTTGLCNTAFCLEGIFYSTITSCGSDDCIRAWIIKDCNGLSLETIGAEHCHSFMQIEGSSSRNIRVSNTFVCVYNNDQMTSDEWNNYIVIGNKVKQIVFDGLDLEMNEPKALSRVRNGNKSFIRVKGDRSSLTINNSYCGLGDVNGFIHYSR